MKVNYKSDFELTIQLTAGGVDVAAPSWDWQLRFYTFDRQAVYTVAHIDGKAERCAVNTDGTITAYFDKHGLMPGVLRCEFVNLVPDSHYTHDTQMQVDPVELGVELWRGASDGGMDAVTLELAGQVLAEVQALAADLQQKAESGYFDGEPGPQGPQGPPGPAGPGLLVVTVTGSDQEALTADHTAAEILAAHEAGRPVVAVYDGEVYQLASVGASLASFSLASADLEVLAQIDVHADGGAVRIFDEIQGVLTAGDGITIDGTTISAPSAVPFVVTLSPDIDQQIVADKTFAEVYALLVAGNEVMFDLDGGYWKPMGFSDTVISASLAEAEYGGALLGGLVWNKESGISFSFVNLQEKLMFDDVPTQSSNNPVKSGGVFTALQSKADRRRVVDNSQDASVVLAADTYNQLGTTDAPVVVLPASYTAADEFLYSFTCATDACVVTLPKGVVLADCCDGFSEVAAGVWFQVSIMDGVAAYLCVTPQN